MSRIQKCQLPNGMEVFFRSKVDVDILARELFDTDNLYLRLGISISEGDCIMDVGANIGFFNLFVNRLISAGRLYSFEPIPDVFEILKLNTDRHNRLELKLFNCGLSNQNGPAQFTYFPRTSVASTMYPDNSREYRRNSRRFVIEEMRLLSPLLRRIIDATPAWTWWPLAETLRRHYQLQRTVTCQLRRASDVIRDEQIRSIDLLKVDTEGAEEDVMAGIDAEHWPMIRQVLVEVHHGQASLQRMEHLLQSHGFQTVSEPVVPGVEHLHVIVARR